MSDVGLTTVGPKHSRSTSITTSKKTTSHQRKPSLNQIPIPTSDNIKRVRPNITTTPSSTHKPSNLPRFINAFILRIHTFLNPSGPLLPHAKHGSAFGGTLKPSLFTRLIQSRLVRFIALFYVIFSVFLTINHSWKYATSTIPVKTSKDTNSVLDDKFNKDWIPQRTYDQGKFIYTKSISTSKQLNRGNLFTHYSNDTWFENAQIIQQELL